MLSEITLATFAFASVQSADHLGLLIATDEEMSTSIRLFETDDAVRFEFTGPDSIVPSVAIDIYRNGTVDRNVDFRVSAEPDDSPCLSYLLDETRSTTCKPIGDKATVVQDRGKQEAVTTFSFSKRNISGDGFGFGFSVRLWSLTGHYGTSVAGGDYQFGGKLSLVSDSPNFEGRRKLNIPSPMLPALRRYEGCVNKAIDALAPLDRSRAAEVMALPTSCIEERSIALDEGVNALVASGTHKDEATEMMRSSLDQYDDGIGQMAEQLEKGGY